MADDDELARVQHAYARAWAARESGGSASADALIEELDACESEVFSGPGPGRDLLVTLWERGVPPGRLRSELIRALPGIARTAFSAWGRALAHILNVFGPEGRPAEDDDREDGPPET